MEKAVQFSCGSKKLYGILHLNDNNPEPETIVLLVVGGPQTRVGSHRLYVQLARYLSNKGISSFRFDYEGNGDSEGDWVGYKYAGESIKAAISYLKKRYVPLKSIFIWSLCDGATSCLKFTAENEDLVSGLILCNPYLHSEEGQAKTLLKYYYLNRLLEIEFWKKIFRFQFSIKNSVSSFLGLVKKVTVPEQINKEKQRELDIEISLEDVYSSIRSIQTPTRYILSANDLAAKQFEDFISSNSLLKKNSRPLYYIKNADHTFSDKRSKERAFETTLKIYHELISLNT